MPIYMVGNIELTNTSIFGVNPLDRISIVQDQEITLGRNFW